MVNACRYLRFETELVTKRFSYEPTCRCTLLVLDVCRKMLRKVNDVHTAFWETNMYLPGIIGYLNSLFNFL